VRVVYWYSSKVSFVGTRQKPPPALRRPASAHELKMWGAYFSHEMSGKLCAKAAGHAPVPRTHVLKEKTVTLKKNIIMHDNFPGGLFFVMKKTRTHTKNFERARCLNTSLHLNMNTSSQNYAFPPHKNCPANPPPPRAPLQRRRALGK